MLSMESDITDRTFGCDELEFEDVKVQKPKYEINYYVSYEIIIETENVCFSLKRSSVRRRYSECLALHKILTKEFPAIKCPPMPPKFPFKNHLDPNFVEKRREQLEEFFKKLLSKKIYLSSKALHLFLQSNLTINEIKDVISGKRAYEVVKDDVQSNRTMPDPFRSTSSTLSVSSFDDNIERVENNGKSPQSEKENGKGHNDEMSEEFLNSCNIDSPRSKKVSFCEQVTVAQIHAKENS